MRFNTFNSTFFFPPPPPEGCPKVTNVRLRIILHSFSFLFGCSGSPLVVLLPAECQCLRPRGVCTINFTFIKAHHETNKKRFFFVGGKKKKKMSRNKKRRNGKAPIVSASPTPAGERKVDFFTFSFLLHLFSISFFSYSLFCLVFSLLPFFFFCCALLLLIMFRSKPSLPPPPPPPPIPHCSR